MTATEHLTHSRFRSASECLRKHYYEYEALIEPDREASYFRFGTLYHLGCEMSKQDPGRDVGEIAELIRAKAQDPFQAEAAIRLWLAHDWFYGESPWRVTATERQFDLPLVNPDTGEEHGRFRFAGKLDEELERALVQEFASGEEVDHTMTALGELKTTSQDIALGSDYWIRLRVDQQVTTYLLATRMEGSRLDTVLYDVARRPELKPYKATPPEKLKIKKDGTPYKNQRLVDETPVEYGQRVAADIYARPEHYFRRVEVARTDDQLHEFQRELWEMADMIADRQDRGVWPKNTGACIRTRGSTCPFLGLCADGVNVYRDGPVPEGYRRKARVHSELNLT